MPKSKKNHFQYALKFFWLGTEDLGMAFGTTFGDGI
jgi:hypothetical protein